MKLQSGQDLLGKARLCSSGPSCPRAGGRTAGSRGRQGCRPSPCLYVASPWQHGDWISRGRHRQLEVAIFWGPETGNRPGITSAISCGIPVPEPRFKDRRRGCPSPSRGGLSKDCEAAPEHSRRAVCFFPVVLSVSTMEPGTEETHSLCFVLSVSQRAWAWPQYF